MAGERSRFGDGHGAMVSLLEREQIVDDRCSRCWSLKSEGRHQAAGLDLLRIDNPAPQILRRRSAPCPDASVCRLIRCVRSGAYVPRAGVPRTRWQLTHDSARNASFARRRRRLFGRRLRLRAPASARSPRASRPRRAAACWRAACRNTRRTGPRNRPGSLGLEPHVIRDAGNQVGLAGQPRHPKAMADVGRLRASDKRAAAVPVGRWPARATRWR